MNKLSCILISCDSEKNKGKSIFHTLSMILKQDLDDFELILFENSHNKTKKKIVELGNYVEKLNKKRVNPIDFLVINKKSSLNVNLARNFAAKKAKSNLLLFIEDDTIMLDYSHFSLIYDFSKNFDFGFGARRFWTSVNWFQRNSNLILEKINSDKISFLNKYKKEVPKEYKRDKDIAIFYLLQKYTFIANFGFCKKDLFLKVGGFPIYKALDLSDDCLMYRLFNLGARYKFLGDLSVLHVSHYRERKNNRENLNLYMDELKNNNHYWCHIHKAFNKRTLADDVIEELGSIHYDYRLRAIYLDYLRMYPLDINKNSNNIFYWKENNALNIMDFSFLINKLINTKFLNDFIKKSSADFDNLAIIIKLSIDNNIVKINKDGRIKYLSFFEKNQKIFLNENKLIPNNKLNQFPCDFNSRKRRAKFIIDRYPFVEYLRFAVIGEDDFISPFFKDMNNFFPIVLEKDKRIIKKLKSINKNLKIFDIDLAKENSFDECNIPDISTFITDPPYTFNGALLFIMRGLSLLSDNSELKEFYVVLNPTMMGKNIQKIINILSASQVFLHRVIENFSQYKLPINFKERERANNFLKKMKIKEDSLLYSSSSNLYIFRTYKPNIKNIKEYINLKKLYQHYL